jgi:hypothetical protein
MALTIIPIEFVVIFVPAEQGEVEVTWQLTTSPFRGIYVNVGVLVPLIKPFTFH